MAQFCVAKAVLMTPWSEPARFALLPMVVKQGTACTSAGQGEINAAFQSVTSITQIFMPACWVWLFNMSYRQVNVGKKITHLASCILHSQDVLTLLHRYIVQACGWHVLVTLD